MKEKEWGYRIYQMKRGENDIRKSRNFVSVFLAYFLVFKYDIDTYRGGRCLDEKEI